MKRCLTAILLILGTQSHALNLSLPDPNCKDLKAYHHLSYLASVVTHCRPEKTQLNGELRTMASALRTYLLSIHPGKENELAQKRILLGLPDPADCNAAQQNGKLRWIEDWLPYPGRMDAFFEKLANAPGTVDWMKCVE